MTIRTNQRGRELELQIERTFQQLDEYTPLVPIRLEVKTIQVDGRQVRTQKQPFDFMVVGPRVWGFDAKMTQSAIWHPRQACPHQLRALNKMQSLGHKAGFVVQFAGDPFPRWHEDLVKPAREFEGPVFDWEMFL